VNQYGSESLRRAAQASAVVEGRAPRPSFPRDLGRAINGRLPLLSLLSIAGFLVAWWLITALSLVPRDLLPSIGDVWRAFVDILQHGYRGTTLAEDAGATVARCLTGFGLGTLVGVPLGLWLGRSAIAAASLDYIIQFMRPLPPLSYLILLILWLGTGDGSKIALLFLAAFPTITSASMAGVRGVNQQRVQAALACGANHRQVFWRVVLPSALPMILTGLRISLAGTFSTVVAAELMAASDGLGWMVFSASQFLRTDIVMVGILLLGVIGMTLSGLLFALDRRVVHWRGRE
jgi:taurine transport system permease protein